MKSEHRHELQTNDLSRIAGRAAQQVEKNANYIMIGIVAVLLAVAAGIWWSRSAEAKRTAGWTELSSAGTVEEFANIADEYSGTSVGGWARLREAESLLQQSVQLMFQDRAAGVADVKKAQESFQKALDDDSPAPVRERALLGLARSLETLSDGDTKPAVDAYRQLVREFPESIYRSAAEERIALLETADAQQFYSWFSKENPTRPDRGRPQDVPPEPTPPGGFDQLFLPGPGDDPDAQGTLDLPPAPEFPPGEPADRDSVPTEEPTPPQDPPPASDPAPAEPEASAPETSTSSDAAAPEGDAQAPADDAEPPSPPESR